MKSVSVYFNDDEGAHHSVIVYKHLQSKAPFHIVTWTGKQAEEGTSSYLDANATVTAQRVFDLLDSTYWALTAIKSGLSPRETSQIKRKLRMTDEQIRTVRDTLFPPSHEFPIAVVNTPQVMGAIVPIYEGSLLSFCNGSERKNLTRENLLNGFNNLISLLVYFEQKEQIHGNITPSNVFYWRNQPNGEVFFVLKNVQDARPLNHFLVNYRSNLVTGFLSREDVNVIEQTPLDSSRRTKLALKIDMYSLAVTIWITLTQSDWPQQTQITDLGFKEIQKQFGADFADLVENMLKDDPRLRPAVSTCQGVLQTILQNSPPRGPLKENFQFAVLLESESDMEDL